MKIVSFAISFVLLIVLLFVFFTTYNDVDLEEISITETFDSVGLLTDFTATFEETLGVGTVRSVEFSYDDTLLAIAVSSINNVRVYERNDLGCFDLITPSPSSTGLGTTYAVDFTYNNSVLAVGHGDSPYIKLYDIDEDKKFSTVIDTDLELDNIVYDVKFYGDNYLIVGGDFTNYLQVFKYENGDYTKLSGNIDNLPLGRVWDIEYNNGYIFVASEVSPYILIYKVVGDNLVKLPDPVNLPTDKAYSIDVNDVGRIIAVGITGSPYIKIYKFYDEVATDFVIDVIPTQTNISWAVKFIGNNILYIGGDSTMYKYKVNTERTSFIQQTNDVLTYTEPIYVIDRSNSLDRFIVGDLTGYDCYDTDIEVIYDDSVLSDYPESINYVRQNGDFKDYTLEENVLTIDNQDYYSDITVNYNILDHIKETSPLLVIIPILVVVAVVGSVVFYIKD